MVFHSSHSSLPSFGVGVIANTPAILKALTLALLVVYLIQVFRTWHRLRHIPGPLLNSLTPLVLSYHCVKGDVNAYHHGLAIKYGPLVRIAPNSVMISDAETLRHICSVKAGYRKGLWFEFSRWNLERPSSLSMRDNAPRKERKARMSPAVSSSFYYPPSPLWR